MATRTLAPRKQLPPPPPRRVAPSKTAPALNDDTGSKESDHSAPPAINIAARIAKLQLNPESQRKSSLSIVEHDNTKSIPLQIEIPPQTFALLLAGLDPDYFSWLLARPPPPVPSRQPQEQEEWIDDPPPIPPRRLPPKLPQRPDYHDPPPNTDDDDGGMTVETNPHYAEEAEDEYAPDNAANTDSGLYSPGTCIKCHDFSQVDTHAAQFPRQNVRSLDELAEDLTQPFTYETEKARAIFTWLHHNILYDTQSFFAGTVKPATPQSTLSSGLAVCDGFAGLFVHLAERVELQVYKVTGHGKGFGHQDLTPGSPVPAISHNHAWNCVLMDGEWWLIDATWGAGAVSGSGYNQRFDPSWFSYTPAEFGRRHFPEDPTYQLISEEDGGPIGWEDYIMSPKGPLVYGDFHRLGFHPDLFQPASDTIRNGQMVTFTLFKQCEHMSVREADNYVYALHFPGQQPIPLPLNAEGGWSISRRISGQTEVSLVFISVVDGQDAKGISIRGFNSALGRKAMAFGGLIKWTVT